MPIRTLLTLLLPLLMVVVDLDVSTAAFSSSIVQSASERFPHQPIRPTARHTVSPLRPFLSRSDVRRFSQHLDDADADQDTAVSSDGGAGFDGKGFAGYLAPYALALLAAVAATAAFVQFVLLQ